LEILNIQKSWNYTEYFMTVPPPGYADRRESIHPKRKNSETALIVNEMKYRQVFQDKTGFIPGLSILDLLFNAGPDSAGILNDAASKLHLQS
jgi:hypothetical protein